MQSWGLRQQPLGQFCPKPRQLRGKNRWRFQPLRLPIFRAFWRVFLELSRRCGTQLWLLRGRNRWRFQPLRLPVFRAFWQAILEFSGRCGTQLQLLRGRNRWRFQPLRLPVFRAFLAGNLGIFWAMWHATSAALRHKFRGDFHTSSFQISRRFGEFLLEFSGRCGTQQCGRSSEEISANLAPLDSIFRSFWSVILESNGR